ncbi:hypothetical protein [Syntrophobacter fumaroxidans]|uniref:hypothetical protein n=1 Tax=Syntrophobacter fumaroxidans TaxID=119484 RepID=UPI00030B2D61|nr:hypothetical protein [Syntrophobacter fumaroxidans]
MTLVLTSMFRLPSVVRFTDIAMSHLLDGLTSIVLVPRTIPMGQFGQELRSRFILRGIDFLEIDISRFAATAPVTCFCQELGIKWRDPLAPRILAHLPEACDFPEILPEVVWLTGFEETAPQTAQAWIDAAFVWSGNSKVLRDRGIRVPAVCVTMPWKAELRIPRSDIFFKVFHWWGIPSVLEMRLLCQNETSVENEFEIWQEYLVPRLCVGDPLLMPALLETRSLEEREIGPILQEIAIGRGWRKESLDSLGIEETFSLNDTKLNRMPELSGQVLSLWGEGVLNWTPDNGLSISSAALQIIGKHVAIKHRMWRGQSELVLPMIDALRLRVCDYMAGKHGCDWPIAHVEPKDLQESVAVRQTHYNCQLGHMETVLASWPSRQPVMRETAACIRGLRPLRNDLAHNRVMTFSKYQDLCERIDRVLNLLNRSS